MGGGGTLLVFNKKLHLNQNITHLNVLKSKCKRCHEMRMRHKKALPALKS